MANFGAAFLLVALMPAAAVLRGTTNNMDLSLSLSDMHPAQVGKLLNTVELKWEEARVSSLRNITDEKAGLEDMVKSCSKVAKAIIAGSDGDKDKVVEYMQDVCSSYNEPVDQMETRKCQLFSTGVEGAMSDDAQVNRDNLELSKFCTAFWPGPVTIAAKVAAKKADEEEATRAQQEAKAEEEKTNEALAATQAAQTQAASEAVNKTTSAIQHLSEVEEQVKGLETTMDADANEATKLIDTARQQEQVASEKEAKAEEEKAAAADAAAAAAQEAKDEEKAIEEGDAKADAIAAKAVEKADGSEPVVAASAAAADDAEALKAGDAVAEKIADKALKKDAALLVAKNITKVATKNATVTEPKKVVAEVKKVTDAPMKAAEPKKEAKKVEVAKKF